MRRRFSKFEFYLLIDSMLRLRAMAQTGWLVENGSVQPYEYALHNDDIENQMIGYTTLGTKDLGKAMAFYDALLALVDGKLMMELDHIKFYGTDAGGGMLAICTPADDAEQSCGNGQMVAISGGSAEGADALYNKAIELGATDAGAPGQRLPFFYGSYVRDADGNKLCFYHMTAA